jgi:hypothetical protein
MSVLQHIVQHAQIGGLIPALGAVQQQWRSMSLYNNPDWKYHFKYGVNSERGQYRHCLLPSSIGFTWLYATVPDALHASAAVACCRQEGAGPHFPQAAPGCCS